MNFDMLPLIMMSAAFVGIFVKLVLFLRAPYVVIRPLQGGERYVVALQEVGMIEISDRESQEFIYRWTGKWLHSTDEIKRVKRDIVDLNPVRFFDRKGYRKTSNRVASCRADMLSVLQKNNTENKNDSRNDVPPVQTGA